MHLLSRLAWHIGVCITCETFDPATGLLHCICVYNVEVLLRSRAIETQTYVIAAAQIGQHNEKRASYGNAMVIDAK